MNYPGLVGWRQQNFRLEFHVDGGGLHQMHAFSLIQSFIGSKTRKAGEFSLSTESQTIEGLKSQSISLTSHFFMDVILEEQKAEQKVAMIASRLNEPGQHKNLSLLPDCK